MFAFNLGLHFDHGKVKVSVLTDAGKHFHRSPKRDLVKPRTNYATALLLSWLISWATMTTTYVLQQQMVPLRLRGRDNYSVIEWKHGWAN